MVNQRKGDAGNTVTEILVDPQGIDKDYAGGTAMVAMLYFSHDSDVVGVEYYSTAMGVYRSARSFDVNHTHAYEDKIVAPTCKDKGYTAHVCTCGHQLANTDSVPALPHTYDNDFDATCNVCGDLREINNPPIEGDTADSSDTQDNSVADSTDTPEDTPEEGDGDAGEAESGDASESDSENTPESDSADVSESEDGNIPEADPENTSGNIPENDASDNSENTPEDRTESTPEEDAESDPSTAPDGDGNDGGDRNGGDGPTVSSVIAIAFVGAIVLIVGGFVIRSLLLKRRR